MDAQIVDLRPGMSFAGRFACARKDRLRSRNGSPYLALELRDRTGALPARVFRDADRAAARFERGDPVRARGKVELFRGELQAELAVIEGLGEGEWEPGEFLPVAYRSTDELEGFFEHLLREVHDPGLRAVVEKVTSAPSVAAELKRAPCTRSGHHAYLGGLIEHTVSVGTLALELCQLHPRLDSDLVMAAVLLHDIGKTREFTYGAEIGISDEGRLLGHLAIGADIIGPAARELPDARRLALLNCVLSHHGPDRSGSRAAGPTRGFDSAEAQAVYRLNALDASVKSSLEGG
ncbi:MAG: 3'-5' exoribonuclease YhaM family protein [Solirubrobacterales bacterium]